MTPCEQKDRIDELHKKLDTITVLQIKQAEIAAAIDHVKGRIDNGMSNKIERIDENLIALRPTIEHHADIIRRIEDIGWLWSRMSGIGLLTAVIGLLVWAVGKGFILK